jgi:hypothetical protein
MKNTKKQRQQPRKAQDIKFNYTSMCCGVQAEKPACVRIPLAERGKDGAVGSLGTWRCTQCGKKCKLTRSLRKAEEPNV